MTQAWRIGRWALLLAVAGCGGGGSDPVVLPPGHFTQGIWRGSAVLDGQDLGLVVGMIAASGQANLILFAGDSQLRGNVESDGAALDTAFSGLSLFGVSGDFSERYEVDGGTVAAGASLTAELTGSLSGRPLTLDLQYDTRYERPASFGVMAGVWRRELDGHFLEWQIDASGLLAGTDSNGCAYAGQVTIPDPTRNLYRMSYQITGCYSSALQVDGQAVLDDGAAAGDTLHSAGTGALGPLNIDSFVERLTRQ
ncbi:hypothetical protein [uncultured Piscinibacter sp.]|uniref:hypothetical protein n=1 Tax=uncultured Piscinibacter sp. TaxID=1131835 RepID=UPI0026283238|nr:hypothetical protein [uncultured Piscinibacter sp.]